MYRYRTAGKGELASLRLAERCGLLPGDHLRINQGVYSHHGIYLGDGLVAHYKGLAQGVWQRQQNTSLSSEQLVRFSNQQVLRVVQHKSSPFSRTQVVERACSRLGENAYNLLTNNCEHFANWCWLDKARSRQVQRGFVLAFGVGVTVFAAARKFKP